MYTQKTSTASREQVKEQLRLLGVNIEHLDMQGLTDKALGDLLTGLRYITALEERRV
jgi:hypothetical protein